MYVVRELIGNSLYLVFIFTVKIRYVSLINEGSLEFIINIVQDSTVFEFYSCLANLCVYRFKYIFILIGKIIFRGVLNLYKYYYYWYLSSS